VKCAGRDSNPGYRLGGPVCCQATPPAHAKRNHGGNPFNGVIHHPRVHLAVHRGGGAGSLQNKVEGIRRAVEAGADVVEIDVHFSSDGVPFLYHDRWINGRNVYDYSSEELKSLGLDTLQDVLENFDVTFYIDLKGEPKRTFIDLIERRDVIIGSFNGLVLRSLKEMGFRTSLILSTVVPPQTVDELATSVGADYVNLGWEHHLPKNYMELLREIRTPIISWTENNEGVFQNLMDVVDVLMTDRLDLIKKYGWKK
jgi:glycerophosphoryl diester phosphodiesterase